MGLMGGCTFSSDDIVIKSPNDKRLYRLIKLENGLTALLIHDPEIYPQGPKSLEPTQEAQEGKKDETAAKGGNKEKEGALQIKKAAAAMCVGVGSFSDPLEAQGLAHFLEHMLFMGSKDFPDENEYNAYLSKHGGSSNAYTSNEFTCYYFEVKREFLKGALTRFSLFFVSPLIKSEAMEREVQAIDSEFNRVLQNDCCRLEQLQALTHSINSLGKSLDDATKTGINLHEQILKLYRDYYHGGLMKLVVIGGESLDVLEKWVLELYRDVKTGPQLNLEIKEVGPTWEAGKVYRLQSVADDHILRLTWTLPCLRQHYKTSPVSYLLYLLDIEGRGSLHFYLKARGWATDQYVWATDYSVAYVFCMTIRLTGSGLEKIFEIISLLYQYIKLLRQLSPQEWVFREYQGIGDISFKFLEEQPQDDYASQLAVNLLYYAAEHAICRGYMYEGWDEELIKYVLGLLNPDNMRIDVISKNSIKSEDFQCEPWFGSHYTVEDVSPSLMDLWKDPPEIDISLHLPAKNEFIPRNFAIRADISCLDTTNLSSPRCILDEPLMKFWYKLDSTFKLPRLNTFFRINLKGGCDSLKNRILTDLYVNLLEDELSDIIYQQTSASALRFQWLPVLLLKILETLKNFLPTYDRFEVIKEDKERAYNNMNMNPWCHASYLRCQVLSHDFPTVEEKLHVLNGLSVSDLTLFTPDLFSQLYIEGLIHGNMSEEEAVIIPNIFKSKFSVQPLSTKLKYGGDRCVSLPSNSNLVIDATVKNKSETNSVTELFFQIEWVRQSESNRLEVLIDLFDEIVKEPLFNQLRTKEQLGYHVQCGSTLITCSDFAFYFCVQSSEYNPIHLQSRLDNFITSLEDLLERLDDDSFENYKGGLMAMLLKKDTSLICETERLWTEIASKRYMFDYSQKLAEELRSLQKTDVINFYKTYLQKSSPKCRRLTTRVWGCNTDLKEAKEAAPESGQVIEDIAAFKLSSKFYSGSGETVTPNIDTN